MTYTNQSLISHFVCGGESGKCNNMAIEERDDWTYLWGYGHALYAARSPDGTLYVYMGWYGRSNTTSTHMNKLKSEAKQVYPRTREEGEKVRALVDGDGGTEIVESPPTGRVLVLVDEGRPGTSYGKLDAEGRLELEHVDGKHLRAPSGTSGK